MRQCGKEESLLDLVLQILSFSCITNPLCNAGKVTFLICKMWGMDLMTLKIMKIFFWGRGSKFIKEVVFRNIFIL